MNNLPVPMVLPDPIETAHASNPTDIGSDGFSITDRALIDEARAWVGKGGMPSTDLITRLADRLEGKVLPDGIITPSEVRARIKGPSE